ncbi:MAG: tyrosine-type recombinase/integrase [Burkholderiales bacterium]
MPDDVIATGSDPRAHLVERCIEAYTTELSRLGYRPTVVRQKRAMVACFARWVERRRLDVARIDEAAVDAFLVHLGRRRVRIGNRRCTLLAFLGHLRGEATRARPEPEHDDSPAALLLQRYEIYLREERGLTKETVCNYRRLVSPLVFERFAGATTGAPASGLGLQEVRDYLLRTTRTLAPATVQLVATALRSFLRFLFLRGETTVDVARAVPSGRRWREARVHPYLCPEEVEQLLAACDRTSANGRRDHAILLLLARLGLRACEVAAIEIGDLRWRAGEIVVRGKGQVHQRLPMLPDVGAALALYLREGRPMSASRNLFLRNDAPRIGLGADAVGLIVRRALGRAGLHPPHRGSHLLRFSLATTMIRRGASMAQIAEVLRHRSPETTEIYAKVDFEALRAVALPWTGLGGAL